MQQLHGKGSTSVGYRSTKSELTEFVLPSLLKDMDALRTTFPELAASSQRRGEANCGPDKMPQLTKLTATLSIHESDTHASLEIMKDSHTPLLKKMEEVGKTLCELGAAQRKITQKFNRNVLWLQHCQILWGLYAEVQYYLALGSSSPSPQQGADAAPEHFAITRRLAHYVHRLKHPVYVLFRKDLKFIPLSERVTDLAGNVQVASPFLWDLDLGFRLTPSSHCALVTQDGVEYPPSKTNMSASGADQPRYNPNFSVERRFSATIGFGTSTRYFLAQDLDCQECKVLNELLSPFETVGPSNILAEHDESLTNLWNWSQIIDRHQPIMPFDSDLVDRVLSFLRSNAASTGTSSSATSTGPTPVSAERQQLSGSVTFLFGTPEACYSTAALREKLEKRTRTGKTLPDTLLPLVMEHRTGVRVYPYTRDPTVFEFYSNTKTDVTLRDLEQASEFIAARQLEFKYYLSHHSRNAAPYATESDAKYNSLEQVPPPVCFSNNLVAHSSAPVDLDSNQLARLFAYKTRNDKIDGSEFRRIYVRDQSQYVLDVDEVPALMGDFGGGTNNGSQRRGLLGNEDQVRFVLDINKYPTLEADVILRNADRYAHKICQFWSRKVGDPAIPTDTTVADLRPRIAPKFIFEDFRHKLDIGCHSGFQQVGTPLYATLDSSKKYAEERLTFGKDIKSHKCHLETSTSGVHFAYLPWGSKAHRARLVEDLDICDKVDLPHTPGQPVQVVYKKDAYLFFVDNAPQMYETGFKRFTECHLYSLISKYIFKYNIIIEMMEVIAADASETEYKNVQEISNLEIKLRNILHLTTLRQREKKPGQYIPDQHGTECFATHANATHHKCAILRTSVQHQGDMTSHYNTLFQRDLQLKQLLKNARVVQWLLKNAKLCPGNQIELPEQESSDETEL